jgi:hypothetical protein
MIAKFACWSFEQKNNGEAMQMAKGLQRGEMSSQHRYDPLLSYDRFFVFPSTKNRRGVTPIVS